MKFRSFDIEKIREEYHLSRKDYPRINLILDFSRDIPFLTGIDQIDDCSPQEMSDILADVEEFIRYIGNQYLE
jgi:hypothetical protein